MATFSNKNIRHELALALRNGAVISDTVRGVTNTTFSATSSNGQTSITLGQTNVRNLHTFTIGGTSQAFIRDYTINFSTGVVTMVSAISGTIAISVNFDYGGSEKIFPDFPRDDLSLNSYPRVGIALTNVNTEPFDLGAGSDINEIVITIFAMVPANKDSATAGGLGGTDDLSDLVKNIRDTIRSNKKTFTSFPLILPLSVGPITYSKDNKIMMQSIDCQIRFLVE